MAGAGFRSFPGRKWRGRYRNLIRVIGVQIVLLIVLFLALLLAILALQNQEPMEIALFAWRFHVPKILVILGSAFAGAFAVFLAGLFRRFGRRTARRRRKEEEAPAPVKNGVSAPAEGEGGRTAGEGAVGRDG